MKFIVNAIKNFFSPAPQKNSVQCIEEELAQTHAFFSVRKEQLSTEIENLGKSINALLEKRLAVISEEADLEDRLKALEKILNKQDEEVTE